MWSCWCRQYLTGGHCSPTVRPPAPGGLGRQTIQSPVLPQVPGVHEVKPGSGLRTAWPLSWRELGTPPQFVNGQPGASPPAREASPTEGRGRLALDSLPPGLPWGDLPGHGHAPAAPRISTAERGLKWGGLSQCRTSRGSRRDCAPGAGQVPLGARAAPTWDSVTFFLFFLFFFVAALRCDCRILETSLTLRVLKLAHKWLLKHQIKTLKLSVQKPARARCSLNDVSVHWRCMRCRRCLEQVWRQPLHRGEQVRAPPGGGVQAGAASAGPLSPRSSARRPALTASRCTA